MLLATLLIGSAFTFTGGRIDDLSRSLRQRFGYSVVCGIYEPDTVPAFTAAEGDLSAVAKALNRVAPFTLKRFGTCLAVAPTRLPSCTFNILNSKGYLLDRTPIKRADLKLENGYLDGEVKPGQEVNCQRLIGLKWGSPLRMQTVFGPYGLIVSAKHAKSNDALDAVAYCIGALITRPSDTFRLVVDPAAWRSRLRASANDPAVKYEDGPIRSGEFMRLNTAMLVEATDQMPDNFLIERFEHPTSYAGISIPKNSTLSQIAAARVTELWDSMQRPPFVGTDVGKSTQRMLDMIDPDAPYRITYCAPVRIGLELLARDGILHIVL